MIIQGWGKFKKTEIKQDKILEFLLLVSITAKPWWMFRSFEMSTQLT